MLTESFLVSILSPEKASNNTITKDGGIYLHEYQPFPASRSTFKKSSTNPNCLAINATHIFAAQAEKAVIHVYNRERGNQEALIPFHEKISSLSLVGDLNGGEILAIGTEGGRIMLWELCTGRLISTPQSHLQAMTCMVVDLTKNFLLTGSPDSNIHVWSIPALLSFSSPSFNDSNRASPYSPVRSLSTHRAAITALVVGHSSSSVDFAISGSKDNTCITWDYRTGTILHTFLLPTTPLCLAIDPADRAFYAGYEDGSIQLVDFYKDPSLTHILHVPSYSTTPTQPPHQDRWPIPADSSFPVLSMTLSYDGTILLSGHTNGKIQKWDIAKGRYNKILVDLSAPITNLYMLPPVGFPNQPKNTLKIINVVKPRYESSLTGSSSHVTTTNGLVPNAYTFTAQFATSLPFPRTTSRISRDPMADFDAALTHPSFPLWLLEEGLTALCSPTGDAVVSTLSDSALQQENAMLRAQVAHARAAQQAHAENAIEMGNEILRRDGVEKAKRRGKRMRRMRRERAAEVKRKVFMGEMAEEKPVDEGVLEGEEDLSSSTDEMTGSE